MTNPRSKNETLSKTCTSYLEQWVKEQIYGTRKEIKSKYLTKGIDVEDLAIEYYAEQKDLGFVLKNQEHFENDYIKGTPDLLLPDEVIELKSSWDCFTFPLFEDKIDPKYYAQVQGYLDITGREKGKLVYTLQNTPDELEWDEPVDYSELNSKFRIKEYHIDYDPEFIKSVENRVIECREYIYHLTKNL
jgi:hypothetical protein